MSNEPKMNLRDTVVPKSDQLNYDDLTGGPVTVRVVGLAAGSAEQPVIINIADAASGKDMRPFKPCKSMRRVLIAVWGDKGKDWIGKSMILYGDPTVRFGGVEVGGIRISHASGLSETKRLKLTTSRAKRSDYEVKPLAATKEINHAETH